jgi:anaphase-promoting complex subunit 3
METCAEAHPLTLWSPARLGKMHLDCVQDLAPREASVWFQMGKIYKRLDMPDEALRHFSHALDLKPSSGDANLIKAAIEKLHVSEDAEDEGI